MNIQFRKDELDFLQMYNSCSDTSMFETDKFQISSMDNSHDVCFYQVSSSAVLSTVLENKNKDKEKFSLIFSISEFSNLLKFCKDDDIISITDDVVYFGKAQYKLESYDIEVLGDLVIEDVLKLSKSENKKVVHLKNTDMFNLIRNFAGTENELDTVAFFDNYFVSSDRYNIIAAGKTGSIFDSTYFFPTILSFILSFYKLKELNISVIEKNEKYFFQINNTLFFLPIKNDNVIPNIFSDKFKDFFNFPHQIKFNRNEFLNNLKRINIITDSDKNNRVYISFTDGGVIIENKDGVYGKEKLNAVIDNNVQGTMILSSFTLIKILNTLKDDDIYIDVTDNVTDMKAIMIHGKDMSIFFIQNLYKNVGDE